MHNYGWHGAANYNDWLGANTEPITSLFETVT